MNKLILFFLAFWAFNGINLQAQLVFEKPSFQGGAAAKKAYIMSKIRYPEEARRNQVEGMVKLKFIVEPDGRLDEFSILSDPGSGLGEEALRIYQSMPAWNPGKMDCVTRRTPVIETLTFRLKPDNDNRQAIDYLKEEKKKSIVALKNYLKQEKEKKQQEQEP